MAIGECVHLSNFPGLFSMDTAVFPHSFLYSMWWQNHHTLEGASYLKRLKGTILLEAPLITLNFSLQCSFPTLCASCKWQVALERDSALSDMSSYSAVGCLLSVAIYGGTGGSAYTPQVERLDPNLYVQTERAKISTHVIWRNQGFTLQMQYAFPRVKSVDNNTVTREH